MKRFSCNECFDTPCYAFVDSHRYLVKMCPYDPEKRAECSWTQDVTDDKQWIGVDLDGTLAEYHGWQGFEHIGAPIAPMVDRVKSWLQEEKTVKIFTARVSPQQSRHDTEDAIIHINHWCREQFGRTLEITCVKDLHMIELWDDRCRQVLENKGTIVVHNHESAIGMIAAERQRQIDVEGYDANHDKQHDWIEIAFAAMAYMSNAIGNATHGKKLWPFEPNLFKPKGDIRDLIKGGALWVAATDRYNEQAKTNNKDNKKDEIK